MVFSPAAIRGAPHTDIATLTYPGGGTAEQEDRPAQGGGRGFPHGHDGAGARGHRCDRQYREQSGVAMRGASALTLLVAALVLGGALAAGHRHRVYDAVILKTWAQLACACSRPTPSNISLLGLATAVFGVAAGSAGGRLRDHRGHEPVFQLAAGTVADGRRRRGRRDNRAWTGRHLPALGRSRRRCCETSDLTAHATAAPIL